MPTPKEQGIAKLAEAEINLTAQELADIIWLMVQIKQSTDTSEVAPVPTTFDGRVAQTNSRKTKRRGYGGGKLRVLSRRERGTYQNHT